VPAGHTLGHAEQTILKQVAGMQETNMGLSYGLNATKAKIQGRNKASSACQQKK